MSSKRSKHEPCPSYVAVKVAERYREQMRCSKPLVERFERVTRYGIAGKAALPKLGIRKPTQLIVHGSSCLRVGVRFDPYRYPLYCGF
jgi:hypothetical protein